MPLLSLVDKTIDFLDQYGEVSILGQKFYKTIGSGDGETKFQNLLTACGYQNDIKGFFNELIRILEKTNSREIQSLKINKVELAYLFVIEILEVLLPGDNIISIKSVERILKYTNIHKFIVKLPPQFFTIIPAFSNRFF